MKKYLSNGKDFLIGINELLKLNTKDLIIFLPFLFLVILLKRFDVVYMPFFLILVLKFQEVLKGDLTVKEALVSLSLYTIVLPDNFIIMFFVGLLFLTFLYSIIKNKEFYKYKKLSRDSLVAIVLITTYLSLNIILNQVPFQNIFFWLVYNFVFIAIMIIYFFEKDNCDETINEAFNTIVALQFIYLIIFIPFRYQDILRDLIGDWSIGTLGISEGPTLFNLFIFGFMKYMHDFQRSKDKRYILCMFFSFVGAISTVSVSLTMLFIFAYGVYGLLLVKGKKQKLILTTSVVLLFSVFWNVSDPWIKQHLIKTVTDSNYRKIHVKKIVTYDDTFVTLPFTDIKFLFIGNGIGYYSSRAALTTSGYYVGWYKGEDKVKISDYTKEYIKPGIFAQPGISTTETPTSQYISIMGEFGLIGLIIFMLLFFRLFYKEKGIFRLTILYFLCIFILDNWTEFPKVALIFGSILFYIKKTNWFPRS